MIRRTLTSIASIMLVFMYRGNAMVYQASTFNEIKTNAAKLVAGDSLIIAAGTYTVTSADVSNTIKLTQSGIAGKKIFMGTTGNNRVTLDFGYAYGTADANSAAQGIIINGNYWYIRGLHIQHAGDNGMLIEMPSPYPTTAPSNPGGSFNIIDCCTFSENSDAGLQLKNFASYDTIINCDSYNNFDAPTDGGNADGFAPKQNCGFGIYFFGCRSWVNSDDGWDAYYKSDKTQYSSNVTTVVEYCICYKNGYQKNQTTTNSSMNGNGFKMGSKEVAENFNCIRSLAVMNKSKGFDANNNTGDMKMFNCSGMQNDAGDFVLKSGTSTVQNCNSVGSSVPTGTSGSNNIAGSAGDFQSTTVTDLILPRDADGSLSDKTLQFMAPKNGDTKYVNKGSAVSDYNIHPVGIPDVGWIENGYTNGIWEYKIPTNVSSGNIRSVKTDVFIGSVLKTDRNNIKINYTIFSNGKIASSLFDVAGRKVIDIESRDMIAGTHSLGIDMNQLNSGMYVCQMQFIGHNVISIANLVVIKD